MISSTQSPSNSLENIAWHQLNIWEVGKLLAVDIKTGRTMCGLYKDSF